MHALELGGRVDSLAFAPDGETLACALRDRIVLLNARRGARTLESTQLPEQDLVVAFAGARLLSAGGDGNLRFWDTTRCEEVDRFAAGAVGNLAVSPDGRWLVTTRAVAGGNTGGEEATTITIWDLDRSERTPPLLGTRSRVESLAVSAEGLVAVGRSGRTIDLFDVRTGRLVRVLNDEGHDFGREIGVAFRLDLPCLLAASNSVGVTTVWDAATGRRLARLVPPSNLLSRGFVRAVAFAGHSLLVEKRSDGTAHLWRLGDPPELRPRALVELADYSDWQALNGPDVRPEAIALAASRDGALIATSHPDRKVRIWRGADAR